MNTLPHHPLPIAAAPEQAPRELEPLLSEPFASAWTSGEDAVTPMQGKLRGRLLDRLSASRVVSAAMVTVRHKRLATTELAPGVVARTLYTAPAGRSLRPGEPVRARLVELAPGAHWASAGGPGLREWLVLRGSVRRNAQVLQRRDYHVEPAPAALDVVAGDEGAQLFLRESPLTGSAVIEAFTVRDGDAGWPAFAPGIQRRVLWQHDGQAAMLYYAQPGAAVPLHSHGHDEECLMVQGELFLDDVLLQEGDYQLAPAGTRHHTTQTDTGVVIYAHGDLDLRFEA